MRRRRDRHLPFQHGHGIGEAAHPIPAQLHVEVEATTDDVQVIVYETREGTASPEVNDAGLCAGKRQDVFASSDRRELTVLDGDGARRRIGTVQCRE